MATVAAFRFGGISRWRLAAALDSVIVFVIGFVMVFAALQMGLGSSLRLAGVNIVGLVLRSPNVTFVSDLKASPLPNPLVILQRQRELDAKRWARYTELVQSLNLTLSADTLCYGNNTQFCL